MIDQQIIDQMSAEDLDGILKHSTLAKKRVGQSNRGLTGAAVIINKLDNEFRRINAFTRNVTVLREAMDTIKPNALGAGRPSVDVSRVDTIASAITELAGKMNELSDALEQGIGGTSSGPVSTRGGSSILGKLTAGAVGIAAIGGLAMMQARRNDDEPEEAPRAIPLAGRARPAAAPQRPPANNARTRDYADLTRKAIARPLQNNRPSSMVDETQSVGNKFASWLGKTFMSVTSYVTALPLMLAGLASSAWGAASDFGGGFIDGFTGNEAVSDPTGSAATAMNYFLENGWSREQAAGIVGNLQVESGNFAADVVAGQRMGDMNTPHPAIGIAQWRNDRVDRFRSLYGRPLVGAPLNLQLQYVNWELNNTERAAGRSLRQAQTAQQAALIVQEQYERSAAGSHTRQRVSNAVALAQGNGGSFASNAGQLVGRGARMILPRGLSLAAEQMVDSVPGTYRNYVRMSNGNVNMNVNPTMLSRFTAMAYEYNQTFNGAKITVNSGFRSREQQTALRRRLGSRAAPPGTSKHEVGLALDINTSDANRLQSSGLLSRYGFHRPVRGETWHIEPYEANSLPRGSGGEELGSDGRPLVVADGRASGTMISGTGTRQPPPAPAGAQLGFTMSSLPAAATDRTIRTRTAPRNRRPLVIVAPSPSQSQSPFAVAAQGGRASSRSNDPGGQYRSYFGMP